MKNNTDYANETNYEYVLRNSKKKVLRIPK